ncbi:MAG: glutamate racemase [Lachnospiraceae bacterium]|nr:glutamate racemase [Lachnospiraceae bacterium]
MDQNDNIKDLPIGVFDSGIGGLTVFREIMSQMPNERLIYFGDTARVPYGNKSRDTIEKYSLQISRFLLSRKVKAIVVACNTASAFALDALVRTVPVPVIGVVEPGAKAACEATKNGRIGVIGTMATISSHSYDDAVHAIREDAEVISRSCPLFVPLAEEGLWEDPVTDEITRRYLAELTDRGIDTLIMGCTHYPLLRSTIARFAGEGVTLVNPAYETAKELHALLEKEDVLTKKEPVLGQENRYQFFVSDMADQFKAFANSIIPYGILSAKVIDIESY